MTIKDQLLKLKENWLIVLLIVVIALFSVSGGILPRPMAAVSKASYDMSLRESGYGSVMPVEAGFAPGVVERKITKTASLGISVDNGEFSSAEKMLKDAITASGSYLLNENVNVIGKDEDAYHQGSYQIKVESSKYSSVTSQFKEIGKVESFNENAEDITAQYVNNEIELKAEKARLEMFKGMMADATNVADKINLADRIFDQERRIQYLEEALKNKDTQVEYSTVYVSLNEEPPAYLGIKLVKFSELVRSLVNSFNSLLELIFIVLPYAVAVGIIWLVYRLIKYYESNKT